MKTFRLNADVLFKAEDVEEALLVLAEHFYKTYTGQLSDPFDSGEIIIKPAEHDSDQTKIH